MDFNALQDVLAPKGGMLAGGSNSDSVESHYKLLQEIGRGAYGVVWKAAKRNNRRGGNHFSGLGNLNGGGAGGGGAGGGGAAADVSGPFYAVKHINKKAAGPKGLQEVMGEVETMSLLTHPNIVRLEETYQNAGNLWIVMEYLAGGSLQELYDASRPRGGSVLNNNNNKDSHRNGGSNVTGAASGAAKTAAGSSRGLPEPTVRRLVVQLLLALEYIHERGIVHRDLKPANCLLTADRATLKISDFGFAVLTGTDPCLTSYCGTVAYMAPEILLQKNYGKPVDMWALGVMVYFLFAGEYPFEGHNSSTMRTSIIHNRSRLAGSSRMKQFPIMADFISKLLVTDPTARLTAREALTHAWIKPALDTRRRASYMPGNRSALDDDDDADGGNNNSSRNGEGGRGGGGGADGGRAGNKGRKRRDCLQRVRQVAIAIMAAHRLRYLQKLRRLVRNGWDKLYILRDFHYLVTGQYVLPSIPNGNNGNINAGSPFNLPISGGGGGGLPGLSIGHPDGGGGASNMSIMSNNNNSNNNSSTTNNNYPSRSDLSSASVSNGRVNDTLYCSGLFASKPMAVEELLPMIESCPAIAHIDLSRNNIDNFSVIQNLLRVVGKHPGVRSLNLSYNPIPALAGRGLLRLARNPLSNIRKIVLDGTPIAPDTIQQIQASLRERHPGGGGGGGGTEGQQGSHHHHGHHAGASAASSTAMRDNFVSGGAANDVATSAAAADGGSAKDGGGGRRGSNTNVNGGGGGGKNGGKTGASSQLRSVAPSHSSPSLGEKTTTTTTHRKGNAGGKRNGPAALSTGIYTRKRSDVTYATGGGNRNGGDTRTSLTSATSSAPSPSLALRGGPSGGSSAAWPTMPPTPPASDVYPSAPESINSQSDGTGNGGSATGRRRRAGAGGGGGGSAASHNNHNNNRGNKARNNSNGANSNSNSNIYHGLASGKGTPELEPAATPRGSQERHDLLFDHSVTNSILSDTPHQRRKHPSRLPPLPYAAVPHSPK